MATIYRKTAKGQTEIETRALKLAPRLRSMLILVDGRRSDAELAQMIPQAGAEVVQALAADGFIEAVEPAAEAVVASGPRRQPSAAAAPVAAPAVQAPDFEARRSQAVRHLTDLVGPVSEALALRMERARDEAELLPLIAMAVQLVGNTRGRSVAATYAQRHGNTTGT